MIRTLSFLAICLWRFNIFFVALSSLIIEDSTITSELVALPLGFAASVGSSLPARRMCPPVMLWISFSVPSPILFDTGVGRGEFASSSGDSPPRIFGSIKWLCEDIDDDLGANDGSRRFHGVVDLASTDRKSNATSSRVEVNIGIDIILLCYFETIVIKSIVVTAPAELDSSIGCKKKQSNAFVMLFSCTRLTLRKVSKLRKTGCIAPIKSIIEAFSLNKFR